MTEAMAPESSTATTEILVRMRVPTRRVVGWRNGNQSPYHVTAAALGFHKADHSTTTIAVLEIE